MNSNQRFVLVLAGMFLVGLTLMRVAPAQQTAPQVIRAQGFEVVDARGAKRIELGVDGDGSSRVSLLGKDGREAVRIVVDRTNGGATMGFVGRDSKQAATLGMSPDGVPWLALAQGIAVKQSGGKFTGEVAGPFIGATIAPDGTAAIILKSKNGKERLLNPE